MTCVYCSESVKEVWCLGNLPPSDTFCETKNQAENYQSPKLAIGFCKSCGLSQNTDLVSELDRYQEVDYSYSSANSEYARSHWREFSEHITGLCTSNEACRILEIGSNDGFCANEVQRKLLKSEVYGLDASPYQVKNAAKNYQNISFKSCIFGLEDDDLDINSFKIIYANNVVNHSNKLKDFIARIYNLLQEDGYFVMEVPLLDLTFSNGKWDQIYHEHVSYFTLNSIRKILGMEKFEIVDLQINDYHGGSIRVTCTKGIKVLNDSLADCFFTVENKIKILEEKALHEKRLINKKIQDLNDKSGRKIYFFGAPAKGATFINFSELDYGSIAGCLESSDAKIGKFIPKCGIPIINELDVETDSYVINLLWNIPKIFEEFCDTNNLKAIKYGN